MKADIPKADLHMHAETRARLDRLVSRRDGVAPHDWAQEPRRLAEVPPGMERLNQAFLDGLDNEHLLAVDEDDDVYLEWLTEAMLEAATDGAVLLEVRFGAKWGMRPGFMPLFRDAEKRVQESHPNFYAEALVTGLWPTRPGALEAFEDALRATEDGLAGIDFIPIPYDEEADWGDAYVWASRAADAGLGITAHLGEVSAANIADGLRLPGLTRVGHAVHATDSDELLQQLLDAGVTVECCLTSNLVLGDVPSLDAHPITKLAEAGVPITIASDDPVRTCTSIAREYELAASLGFAAEELLGMTRRAITASFASDGRKTELLRLLESGAPSAS